MKFTAVAFVGMWSLVLGAKSCASSSESLSNEETQTLCAKLLDGQPQESCSIGDSFLSTLNRVCITEYNDEELYGVDEDADPDSYKDETYTNEIITLEGGYIAECDIASGGPFLSRSIYLDGDSDSVTAEWVLDSSIVDVSKAVNVQVRYSSDLATSIYFHSDTGSSYTSQVAVDLIASNYSNKYCTSSYVSIIPTPRIVSGKKEHVIIAVANAISDTDVSFEGLIMSYQPVSSSATVSTTYENYECAGGRSALAECIPTEDDSNCSCSGDEEESKFKAIYAILPVAILGVIALLVGLVAYRMRVIRNVDETSDSGDSTTSYLPRATLFHKRTKELRLETPEDTDMHHIQLDDLLRDPNERRQFTAYLEVNGTLEPILFYESIEMYQACEDKLWRQRESRNMVARFVAPLAPYKVELTQASQDALCNAKSSPINLFDDAKAQIYAYMQINFLEGFLNYRNNGSLTPRRQSPCNSIDEFNITTSDHSPPVALPVASPHPEEESSTQQLGVV